MTSVPSAPHFEVLSCIDSDHGQRPEAESRVSLAAATGGNHSRVPETEHPVHRQRQPRTDLTDVAR